MTDWVYVLRRQRALCDQARLAARRKDTDLFSPPDRQILTGTSCHVDGYAVFLRLTRMQPRWRVGRRMDKVRKNVLEWNSNLDCRRTLLLGQVLVNCWSGNYSIVAAPGYCVLFVAALLDYRHCVQPMADARHVQRALCSEWPSLILYQAARDSR